MIPAVSVAAFVGISNGEALRFVSPFSSCRTRLHIPPFHRSVNEFLSRCPPGSKITRIHHLRFDVYPDLRRGLILNQDVALSHRTETESTTERAGRDGTYINQQRFVLFFR